MDEGRGRRGKEDEWIDKGPGRWSVSQFTVKSWLRTVKKLNNFSTFHKLLTTQFLV